MKKTTIETMCPFSSTTYGSCPSIVRWKYKFTNTQLNISSYVLKLQMTSQYLRKYRKQIGQDEQNKTDSEIIRMGIYSINEIHHEVLIHKMSLIIACVCNQLNNCRHNYINVIHLYVLTLYNYGLCECGIYFLHLHMPPYCSCMN